MSAAPDSYEIRSTPIRDAHVVSNVPLCRDHYRLMLAIAGTVPAEPGQFVHIVPPEDGSGDYRTFAWSDGGPSRMWFEDTQRPLLRRAFSIGGLRSIGESRPPRTEIDLIYRVVGSGTRWMASLGEGDSVSLLGPLGNRFPIHATKNHAWLVAGGVGLPPILWLAEALARSGKRAVAFCGARTRELLPLGLSGEVSPDAAALSATLCILDFSAHGIPAVISSDDGTLGLRGSVLDALRAFHSTRNAVSPDDLVVYTCGPEAMMRAVAAWSVTEGIECQVCMERSMACGIGTCQSCVVALRSEGSVSWKYSLCCTDGPVYDARRISWDEPQRPSGPAAGTGFVPKGI
ncbi:MAG: dihydroorotate dehydrogenase electron transfer subunit [Phycisphaerae bacterium]|nr:dihydroorotate dehydrogenase electron transfer subunit [Phycisphaerae bacterium]